MTKTTERTFSMLSDEMARFRADMEEIEIRATRIASKTNRIIKWVLMMLAIASLVLVFLVYSMSSYLAIMLGHLDDMYAEFGTMSKNMEAVTVSVSNIGDNMDGLPIISESMRGMQNDISGMVGSVQSMKNEMIGMQGSTSRMTVNTTEMAQRFDSVNRAVHNIGYNVNQMGKPMP